MKKKILLIDDETDFLDIMGQIIESWGYEVIPASTGDEAMAALKAQKPDAAVIDYVMPDKNGVELLAQIRKVNKDIPAIIFTAKPEPKAINGAEKLGVLAFIPKLSPYTNTQANLKTALGMAVKEKRK